MKIWAKHGFVVVIFIGTMLGSMGYMHKQVDYLTMQLDNLQERFTELQISVGEQGENIKWMRASMDSK